MLLGALLVASTGPALGGYPGNGDHVILNHGSDSEVVRVRIYRKGDTIGQMGSGNPTGWFRTDLDGPAPVVRATRLGRALSLSFPGGRDVQAVFRAVQRAQLRDGERWERVSYRGEATVRIKGWQARPGSSQVEITFRCDPGCVPRGPGPRGQVFEGEVPNEAIRVQLRGARAGLDAKALSVPGRVSWGGRGSVELTITNAGPPLSRLTIVARVVRPRGYRDPCRRIMRRYPVARAGGPSPLTWPTFNASVLKFTTYTGPPRKKSAVICKRPSPRSVYRSFGRGMNLAEEDTRKERSSTVLSSWELELVPSSASHELDGPARDRKVKLWMHGGESATLRLTVHPERLHCEEQRIDLLLRSLRFAAFAGRAKQRVPVEAKLDVPVPVALRIKNARPGTGKNKHRLNVTHSYKSSTGVLSDLRSGFVVEYLDMDAGQGRACQSVDPRRWPQPWGPQPPQYIVFPDCGCGFVDRTRKDAWPVPERSGAYLMKDGHGNEVGNRAAPRAVQDPRHACYGPNEVPKTPSRKSRRGIVGRIIKEQRYVYFAPWLVAPRHFATCEIVLESKIVHLSELWVRTEKTCGGKTVCAEERICRKDANGFWRRLPPPSVPPLRICSNWPLCHRSAVDPSRPGAPGRGCDGSDGPRAPFVHKPHPS
jgi:hypothetical protein